MLYRETDGTFERSVSMDQDSKDLFIINQSKAQRQSKVKRSVSQIIYSEMVEWYILNNSVKKKKGRNNRDDDDESAEPAQFRIDGGTYENERSIISYRPRSLGASLLRSFAPRDRSSLGAKLLRIEAP